MASMGFVVAILLRIFWIWIPADGEIFANNITLTWNESVNYCQNIGKVLMDVKEDNYRTLVMNRLKDGNQAWVAARIQLSDFIKLPVCMATTGSQFHVSRTFDTDTISNCLKFCKDYRYIGLKERECICINETKSLTPSKACNPTCNKDETRLCGGNQSYSVYERVDTNIIQKIAPGYKECVYALKNGNTTELFTASCFGEDADGGLCETQNTSECQSHKWIPIGSHLCRMDLNVQSRWRQARKFCADIEGQLVSQSELPLSLVDNRTYWLGIHRMTTFQEETLIKSCTYCSVVRREGDIVLIEAEHCEAKKTFLCQDILGSVTSSSAHTTEIHGNRKQTEHAGGTITYLSVSVSVTLLVAIVITILACMFRRRRKGKKTEITADSSSSEHHVLQTNIPPPAKPLRKMHSKKDHIQNSYANTVYLCRDQDVEKQQTGLSDSVPVDYDKIKFDKVCIQDNGINEHGQHIYDHTSLCKTEDQYDMTDLSGFKDRNAGEAYHKITLTQMFGLPNSLTGEDCKLNFETYKQDDNELYDTMEQN